MKMCRSDIMPVCFAKPRACSIAAVIVANNETHISSLHYTFISPDFALEICGYCLRECKATVAENLMNWA